ncbi:hypothetical protein ACI2OX_04730 [Bacillus sp. N9]
MKNTNNYSNIVADLRQRGFSVDQIQVTVNLNDRDLAHLEQIEEERKQQELEMIRLQDQNERDKKRAEIEKEMALREAELEKN